MRASGWLAVGLCLLAGCGRGGDPVNANKPAGDKPVIESSPGKAVAKLTVTSSAFRAGDAVPQEFSGEGADRSPPLAWSGAPAGTKEFAVIVHDPDAPVGTWYHWVLYNLPAEVTKLPPGLPRDPVLKIPVQARQGRNSWPSDNVGYRGPMPPKGHGKHRYVFTVYAVDGHIELAPNLATAESLQKKLAGHVLAQGELLGVYERQ